MQNCRRGQQLCASVAFLVLVESEVATGRRRRHQACMQSRRPQGQRSPLWLQWAATWPLVPLLGTLERPTLGSVQSCSTICNAFLHMTHATCQTQVNAFDKKKCVFAKAMQSAEFSRKDHALGNSRVTVAKNIWSILHLVDTARAKSWSSKCIFLDTCTLLSFHCAQWLSRRS